MRLLSKSRRAMDGHGGDSVQAEYTGALDWQSLYAMEREDEQADPMPLMAQQDVSVGPCIAPYLATDSLVVVQVAATCATVFCSYGGSHMSAFAEGCRNTFACGAHNLACKHTLVNFQSLSIISTTAGTTAQQETLVPKAGSESLQLQGWHLTGAGAGGRRA